MSSIWVSIISSCFSDIFIKIQGHMELFLCVYIYILANIHQEDYTTCVHIVLPHKETCSI